MKRWRWQSKKQTIKEILMTIAITAALVISIHTKKEHDKFQAETIQIVNLIIKVLQQSSNPAMK